MQYHYHNFIYNNILLFYFAEEHWFIVNTLHPPQKRSKLIIIYLLAREAEFSFAAFNIAQEVNAWGRNEAGKK